MEALEIIRLIGFLLFTSIITYYINIYKIIEHIKNNDKKKYNKIFRTPLKTGIHPYDKSNEISFGLWRMGSIITKNPGILNYKKIKTNILLARIAAILVIIIMSIAILSVIGGLIFISLYR
jgi:hypothetical protein